MKIQFSKMHGLGNDFVVINNLDLKYDFSAEQISYIADRKFGIGCDQVLIIDHATDGISDFYYKIYNSDGSVAGQCGNGARCFIRYVVEHQLTAKNEIQLQTRDRIIKGRVLENNLYEIDMGNPDFIPANIPLNSDQKHFYKITDSNAIPISFGAVSMGNPHAVIELNSVDEFLNKERLAVIGELLQNSPLFPDSVNVNFVYKVDNTNVQMLTYERGCGFTLACGSGACASAAVLIQRQIVDNNVCLRMPGGELKISWYGENLFMQGSATHVFDGEIML